MCYKYVCLVLYCTSLSYGANILALMPTLSYSHQIAFAPLWKGLSLRGHQVTLVTLQPMNNPKLVNLTEIDMKLAYKINTNITGFLEFEMSMWNTQTFIWSAIHEVCESVIHNSDTFRDLLKNRNKYDLVLVQVYCPEFLAIAELYQCPSILLITMNLHGFIYNMIGEFAHPVLQPEFVTPFHGNLNFRERILSTMVTLYSYYQFTFNIFPLKKKVLEQYFNTTSTIPELLSKSDMLFTTTNPLIHGPRALGPAVVSVGGHREDMSLEPLSRDVEKFLDDAKEGCIFVSLGSNVKSSQLSRNLQKTIKDALSEVPYKVLWKYEKDNADMPKNIKTSKWFPQQKILNHPNVKVFLYQGGLQSMEESIYGEVPFVVIPFFSDQFQNARILQNKGVAIVLDKKTLKKDDLKNALIKVMTDPKYTEGVKKLKRLILDEPMTGLEKTVWWTEYVIRNKGAKHLRNPAADIPLYQYYLLDVISFLLLAVIVTLTVIVFILKRLYKCIYRQKEKTQ